MKEIIKENLEENLGLYAGIILGVLIVSTSLYALTGLAFVTYLLVPIFTWEVLKEFKEDEELTTLLLAVIWLSWFVWATVRYLQVRFS